MHCILRLVAFYMNGLTQLFENLALNVVTSLAIFPRLMVITNFLFLILILAQSTD